MDTIPIICTQIYIYVYIHTCKVYQLLYANCTANAPAYCGRGLGREGMLEVLRTQTLGPGGILGCSCFLP